VQSNVDELPVIKSRPFEMLIINLETQWLDQVERRESCRAQPRNTAGVRRNLGLEQDHVHLR
jgi:hypothetical protein